MLQPNISPCICLLYIVSYSLPAARSITTNKLRKSLAIEYSSQQAATLLTPATTIEKPPYLSGNVRNRTAILRRAIPSQSQPSAPIPSKKPPQPPLRLGPLLLQPIDPIPRRRQHRAQVLKPALTPTWRTRPTRRRRRPQEREVDIRQQGVALGEVIIRGHMRFEQLH